MAPRKHNKMHSFKLEETRGLVEYAKSDEELTF